jgi:hypothetical protein
MSDQLPSETVSTWYRIDKWSTDIKPVQVFKETEHFIYARRWEGQKQPDRISKADHYPTWEQAKAAKLRALKDQMSWKRQELESLSKELAKVEALTP